MGSPRRADNRGPLPSSLRELTEMCDPKQEAIGSQATWAFLQLTNPPHLHTSLHQRKKTKTKIKILTVSRQGPDYLGPHLSDLRLLQRSLIPVTQCT